MCTGTVLLDGLDFMVDPHADASSNLVRPSLEDPMHKLLRVVCLFVKMIHMFKWYTFTSIINAE